MFILPLVAQCPVWHYSGLFVGQNIEIIYIWLFHQNFQKLSCQNVRLMFLQLICMQHFVKKFAKNIFIYFNLTATSTFMPPAVKVLAVIHMGSKHIVLSKSPVQGLPDFNHIAW